MVAGQDSNPETPGGGRVLVVEDDAHIRDLVTLHLQLEGLTAVATGDGAARGCASPSLTRSIC